MIRKSLALALGLFLGIAAAELPEFAQQYRQRLAGAIDELRTVVRYFDEDAQKSGLGRADALALMARNQEPFIRDQGASITRTIRRLDRLSAQQEAFRNAGRFGRLAIFARDVDTDLAAATFRDFEPAVPTTLEGIALAVGGFLVGWAGTHGIVRLFRRRREPDFRPWLPAERQALATPRRKIFGRRATPPG